MKRKRFTNRRSLAVLLAAVCLTLAVLVGVFGAALVQAAEGGSNLAGTTGTGSLLTENSQTENSQTENSQTGNSQTGNSQTENPQSDNSQTENPQAENPQTENPEESDGSGENEDKIIPFEESGEKSPKGSSTYKGVSYRYVYDYAYYTSTRYGRKYAGNPEKAIAHFVKYGMKKGQQAIKSFDPVSYRYGCPALRTKYRSDYKEYYMHFQQTGHKYSSYKKYATGVTKMRNPVTKYGKVELKAIYDYEYYTETHPEVVKKVGDDDRAVLKYFVETGMEEKHAGKDPDQYPKAKPGSDTWKAIRKKITKTSSYDGTGLIVCIDPGHQAHGNYSREQIGPGSGQTKPKVTSGAYGQYSRKNEYEINLEVSLKLRDELLSRGYTVVMTRTTHNVSITNIERAKFANKENADIMVRIHANGVSGASGVNGVLCYAAAQGNPFLKKEVVTKGQRLAVELRDGQVAATGQKKLSNIYQNDMTGINWAKMPCAIVEMGFMSNPTEDKKLANSGFQWKIAKGLANGIDRYFLAEEKKK